MVGENTMRVTYINFDYFFFNCLGGVAKESVYHPDTKELLIEAGKPFTTQAIVDIVESGIREVEVLK